MQLRYEAPSIGAGQAHFVREAKVSIFEKYRRGRVRRAFGKYLSPEVVDKLMRHPRAGELPKNEIRHFQFILVHIDEKQPDEIRNAYPKIIDCFFSHNAILGGIESSLVIGHLGFPWPEKDSVEIRKRIVAALLAENGKLIRVAHGECEGLVGNLGSKRRFVYGGIIPNFSAALKKLFDAEPGTAVEIS